MITLIFALSVLKGFQGEIATELAYRCLNADILKELKGEISHLKGEVVKVDSNPLQTPIAHRGSWRK